MSRKEPNSWMPPTSAWMPPSRHICPDCQQHLYYSLTVNGEKLETVRYTGPTLYRMRLVDAWRFPKIVALFPEIREKINLAYSVPAFVRHECKGAS